MLLELWVASTSASGLYWFFGRKLKKHLESPNEIQGIEAENATDATSPYSKLCAVELSVPERTYSPPVYVGAAGPALLGIPIGGGYSDSEKPLFHSTWNGSNWIVGNNLDLNRPSHQWWVNTPTDLQQLLEGKQISTSSFPASLPLKVSEVRYAKGHTLWHHPPSRLLNSNKDALIRIIVRQKTLGSIGGAIAASATLLTTFCMVIDYQEQKRRLGFR